MQCNVLICSCALTERQHSTIIDDKLHGSLSPSYPVDGKDKLVTITKAPDLRIDLFIC